MILPFKLKYILFLLISFSLIKAEEEINLENGYYSKLIDCKEDCLIFKVKAINDYPYLKIKVEGNGETEKTNHIISYYQDQKLKDIKQLSQSITDTSVMWLTKEQIQNDFYTTIECAKFPCKFNLFLNGKDTAELDVNEQYNYYVTDNNKEMKFRLNCSIDLHIEDLFVTIWTKGNFEINAALNNDKKSDNNNHFFQISYANFSQDEYNLNINGKVGDLINVGLLLVHKNDGEYDFPELKIEEGLEITNYLNQNESHAYNISGQNNMFLGHFYDFNNKIIYPSIDLDSLYYNLSVSDEELRYSIHFLSTTKYDEQGNNKYSPLLDGIYYIKILEEGTNIGLIPMKPIDNFNFLTYEIFPYEGDISASIYKCEKYPLCHTNEKILEKSEKIKDYQSYYYSYTKDEWEKEINPISKKQNMLIINCKKGSKASDGSAICISIINMKTNKKEIKYADFNKETLAYRRFIKKDNEDLYLFKGDKEQDIYLNIETFTGEIKIELSPNNNNIKKFEFGNKQLYIIPRNADINIKIKALKNSVYSIYDNKYAKGDYFKIGSNYLLNLEGNNELTINPRDISTISHVDDYLYYIGIYSLNCTIYVDKENNKLQKNEFYQEIVKGSSEKSFSLHNIDTDKNYNDNCLLYISCHKLEEFTSDSSGIPLGNNTSQSFLFNKDKNSMVFSFPHTEIENDIKIDFKLLTEVKFKVIIMVDGKNMKEDNINSKKANIQLGAWDLKQNCVNFKFICKMLLYLESEEKEKESKIEITINSIKKEDNNKDNDGDDDDKKLIVIFSIIGVIVILLIIGGLFYYCKKYSKNRDLNKAVNQISFKDEDKYNEDDCRDTLLD